MRLLPTIANIWLGGLLVLFNATAAESPLPSDITNARTFAAQGVVEAVKPGERTIVVRHGAISNYMAAMTMPFTVKPPDELAGISVGDEILFQLHVTDTESWIDQIVKIGTAPPDRNKKPTAPDAPPAVRPNSPLLDYKFTNELGQAVSLNGFRGQALAITFFYTRCPLPEYCPRLSKNFHEASQKLESMPGAPANWHFLSISFDTEFDSPAMLKAYGESYQYNPRHWSFLTGPPDKIAELARGSGVTYETDDGTINHNFRTLIIDAAGHLQTVFPTGGNLSDQIMAEIIKASAVTNQFMAQNQKR